MLPTRFPTSELLHRRPSHTLRNSLVAALAAAALGAFAPAVSAQHSHSNSAPTAAQQSQRAALDQRATQLSNGLLQSMKALDNASNSNRAQRASDVVQIAQERRQALLALVEADPGRVLALALPAELRERLPQEALALVEQRVQAEGVVAAMVIEHVGGTSSQPYFLEFDGPGGKGQFNLHWADAGMSEREQDALIEKRVRIKALQLNGHLIVGDKHEVEDAAYTGGKKATDSTGTTDAYAGTALVSGDQKTLVILANFTDKAVGCSTDTVRNAVFGPTASVDQIYRESSRNAVTFSGDVVGPFTIPYSSTSTCDYRTWGSAADAAARAAGVDPTKYTRISYAIPSNGNCGWSGVANVGGTPPTRSWVAQCGSAGLFAHEIGHNLRFKHASTPSSTYGDASDPMGNIPKVQLNGPNKTMAGWLAPGNVVDATSGSYTLAALAAPDTGVAQVVRLRKADTNEFYYVSLRHAIDLDANLSSVYRDLVTVHRSTGTMPTTTVLMARLPAGQSYTDSANGITIAAQSVSSGSATISVQTSGATCSPAAPTLTVGPSTQTAAAGVQVGYTLSLRNNDSSACSSSSFSLAQLLPTGFSGSFSTSSLQLSPGASASVNWSVTPGSVADAIYPLQASASGSNRSTVTKSVSLQVYTEVAPPTSDGTTGTSSGTTGTSAGSTSTADTSPPTVAVTYPGDGDVIQAKPVSLTASAFDQGGVARVDFFVNGAPVGSSSTAPYQVRWNARKAKGANTMTARAVDNVGKQAEASVTFTVN